MEETTKMSRLRIPSNSLSNLIREFATLFNCKSIFLINNFQKLLEKDGKYQGHLENLSIMSPNN